MSSEYAVHENPVWRERADFIIHVKLESEQTEKRWEQLWARQIGENRFEICCIPVFAYDLALGDEVETEPHDAKCFVVARVVKPSGRYVFRLWFGDAKHPATREEILQELQQMGALVEVYSHNLVGVDATAKIAQKVADALHQREQLEHLIYETGHSS